jgi:hypothetical protein
VPIPGSVEPAIPAQRGAHDPAEFCRIQEQLIRCERSPQGDRQSGDETGQIGSRWVPPRHIPSRESPK